MNENKSAMIKKLGIVQLVNMLIILVAFNILNKTEANKSGEILGINYNLLVYCVVVALAIMVAVVEMIMMGKFSISKSFHHTATYAINIVLFLAGSFFAYQIYDNENTIFPGSMSDLRKNVHIHDPYFLFLFMISIALACYAYRTNSRIKQFRIFTIIVASVFCGAMAYAPNPYWDRGGELYHIHAFDNSIISVMKMIPYNGNNISIYGHYGLIIAPVAKILGGNYNAIALAIAVFTTLTYAGAFYLCDYCCHNDMVFSGSVLSIIGIISILYMRGQYYQVNPLRLMMPIVTLVYCVWVTKKSRVTVWHEILIGTIAVVWNFETGLFCIIILCLFNALIGLNDKQKTRIGGLRVGIIKSLIMLLSSFVLAYLLVYFYNSLCGYYSPISVADYIFPIGSKEYIIDGLRLPLPTAFSIYVLQIILFTALVIDGVARIICQQTDSFDTAIIRVCIALSGLSSLTYFMNRASYSNISISWIQFVLAMAIIGDGVLKPKEEWEIMTGMRFLVAAFLFGFAIESTMNLTNAIGYRTFYVWETDPFVKMQNSVKENVPKDTFAFGIGVPELYCELGWETGVYTIDWSDMLPSYLEAFMKEVEKQELIFANKEQWESLGMDGYRIIYETKIREYEFALYEME